MRESVVCAEGVYSSSVRRCRRSADKERALQLHALGLEDRQCQEVLQVKRCRDAEPVEFVALDPLEFLPCHREGRRGAAAGPSGMISDHFFPMLEKGVIRNGRPRCRPRLQWPGCLRR